MKYYCKKLEGNYVGVLKIEKRTETLWNQFFPVNWKKISAERLAKTSLESILNQNKELISKLDDLSKKISSL